MCTSLHARARESVSSVVSLYLRDEGTDYVHEERVRAVVAGSEHTHCILSLVQVGGEMAARRARGFLREAGALQRVDVDLRGTQPAQLVGHRPHPDLRPLRVRVLNEADAVISLLFVVGSGTSDFGKSVGKEPPLVLNDVPSLPLASNFSQEARCLAAADFAGQSLGTFSVVPFFLTVTVPLPPPPHAATPTTQAPTSTAVAILHMILAPLEGAGVVRARARAVPTI